MLGRVVSRLVRPALYSRPTVFIRGAHEGGPGSVCIVCNIKHVLCFYHYDCVSVN